MAVLKLLRNQTYYTTRSEALNAVATKGAQLADGEVWLTTYGSGSDAKTLLAIKRVSDNKGSVTILETNTLKYEGVDAVQVEGNYISLLKDPNDHILSQSSNGLKANVSLKSVTPSSTNVREEYQLIGTDDVKLGDTTIKIYKDSAYKEIYLGSEGDSIDTATGDITKKTKGETGYDGHHLNYAYMKAEGTYDLVKVDVSALIPETIYGDGLDVLENNKIIVKKDTESDSFLTISSNGVKISGISDAISAVESDAADRLSDEAKHRRDVDGQQGDSYVSNANTSYITTASSLNEADVKLDAAIKQIDTDMLTNVVAGQGLTVSEKTNKKQTLSVALDEKSKHEASDKPDNVLTLTPKEGLYLSSVIELGTY